MFLCPHDIFSIDESDLSFNVHSELLGGRGCELVVVILGGGGGRVGRRGGRRGGDTKNTRKIRRTRSR